MSDRVHVIGAGLAGLSAALECARAGMAVSLYEAAPHAGGRCRSFFDDQLERTIDNGGHLLLGANPAAFAFLDLVGGRDAMVEVAPAAFPFRDLRSGETWTVRPNAGPIPWWILSAARRIPGTRLRDYGAALRLLRAGESDTVAATVGAGGVLYERLWDPLCVAVMNAHASEAAALPLALVLRETFGRGEAACRPWVARNGLSNAFAGPALAYLEARGVEPRFGWRLAAIEFEDGRVRALRFGQRVETIAPGDNVVLAVPRPVAAGLIPGVSETDGYRAIVNAHYRLNGPASLPGGAPLLGLVGGLAQWLIAHDDIVSVTVSAADDVVDRPNGELLERLWRDVARAMDFQSAPQPPGRLIKEKRATFAQTAAAMRARLPAVTRWPNLALAGDWTATGLPATIEGAIRSGRSAAALFVQSPPAP